MTLAAPFCASDLGPADDRDELALEAISEDDDFQKSFCESHAWQLIELLETPDVYPTQLAAKAKKLKAEWYAALSRELSERGACAAEYLEDR